MNGGFVHSLVIHWHAETTKPFPSTHFIHFDSSFIFSYFILSFITVLYSIR